MTLVLSALGGLGGLVVFAGAVWAIIRAILAQVVATKANTEATDKNSKAIDELTGHVHKLDTAVQIQAEKIGNLAAEQHRLARLVNGKTAP